MMVVDSSDELVSANFRVIKRDLDRFDRIAIKRRMSRASLFRESMLNTLEEYKKLWS